MRQMSQLQISQIQNYQLGFCILCQMAPIKIKKWGLCQQCYTFSRKKGVLDTRKYRKFRLSADIKHKRFCNKLEDKYGVEIFTDLQDLKTKPLLTLEDVSQKYPITRERIRQIFKEYHGVAYTKYLRDKRAKLKKDNLSLNCSNNPLNKVANYKNGSLAFKGAQGEKLVLEKCGELGLDVQIPCEQTFDLYVNGYKVDVKTSYKSHSCHPGPNSKRRYFPFHILKNQQLIHFLICIIFPYKQFFIIPQKDFSSSCKILIPDAKSLSLRPDRKPSRFLKYKEAWHLLNPRSE